MKKVFVDVIVMQDRDGRTRPMSIIWPDGRVFTVDKAGRGRRRSACLEGGPGIKYDVRIAGKNTYLYEQDRLWFMEVDKEDKTE